MPCFKIDGTEVACTIENFAAGLVEVGTGPDYEAALSAFEALGGDGGSDAAPTIRNIDGYPHERGADGLWYPVQIGDPNAQVEEPINWFAPRQPSDYTRAMAGDTGGGTTGGGGGVTTYSGGGGGGGGGRSYAPKYPSTEITPAGDIFTVDPYTGIPTYVGNDPRLATGLSPSQQRSNEVFDTRQGYDFEREILGLQQGYNTSERLGSQQFQTGERLGSEAFAGGQNDLDRALTAGQFAANLHNANEGNRFAADQAFQQAQERYTQMRLGAAQQVADNISNVDPGALPAFYAAGGGVIANALDVGATGRTPLSDYGSAAALRVAETARAPELFAFDPASFNPYYGMGAAPVAPAFAAAPPPTPQREPRRFSQPAGLGNTPSREEMSAAKPKVQAAANRGDAQFVGQEGGRWRLVNGEWVEAFARGGQTDNRAIVTGDHPSGKQNEELVLNPTGAPISVVPLSKMGAFGRMMADDLPHAATGFASGGAQAYDPRDKRTYETATNRTVATEEPPPPVNPYAMFGGFGMGGGSHAPRPQTPAPVDAGMDSYLERIGDIRDNVQFQQLNPFDVRFSLNAPSQIQRHFAGMQTKFAIPVADQVAEAQRFYRPGTTRGAFGLRI